MATLYKRSVVVFVADRRIEGLRVSFKITKTLDSTANKCAVSIYGLNEASRSVIKSTKKPPLILEVGHEEERGIIFSGEGTRPISEKGRDGWVTTIEGLTGMSAGRRFVNEGFGPGAKPGDVIRKIADKMGVKSKEAFARLKAGDFDGAVSTFAQGITISGPAKPELDKLARTLGFEWSIQDGELQILKPAEVAKNQAIKLSLESGLIGTPKPIKDEKRPGVPLVKATAILQPGFVPGRQVVIESETVVGRFKLEKVDMSGDTHGQAFFADLEGREIG